MDTDTVVIGLALIVVGIFAVVFCCLGGLLALVGLVILIIGLLKSDPRAAQYYQQPICGPPPRYVPAAQEPPLQPRYCPHCGRPHAPDSAWCPYCGKSLSR